MFASSLKKMGKLLDTSSLYMLKHIHLFFKMVNFEQIHLSLSDVFPGCSTNKTILTNSMSPQSYLSLSFLLQIS